MTRGILPLSVDKELQDLILEAELKFRKEGKKWNLSGMLREPIKEFLKQQLEEHGDGNPAYSMDQWINNPEFIATPALSRKPEEIKEYLQKIRKTPEWTKVGQILEENWVKQYNELEENQQ